MFKNSPRVGFILWVVLCLAMVVGFAVIAPRGYNIETDIFALLPKDKQNPQQQKVFDSLAQSMERTVVLLVTHQEYDSAFSLSRKVLQSAQKSPLFTQVSSSFTPQQEQEWFAYYYPKRYDLLTPQIRSLLQGPSPAAALYQRECELLYAPTPDYYGEGLQNDPLMLFADWAQTQQKESGEIEDSLLYFETDSSVAVLITATLAKNPFDAVVQKDFETFLATQKAKVIAQKGALYSTGVVRYAGFAFEQGKSEGSFIGTFSMVGIILVILLVFRSFGELIKGTLPTVVGLSMGVLTGLFLYPSLHIVTITMAGCLTGVAVDYPFHYLADRATFKGTWSQRGTLKRIFPAITLGAVTTAMGYISFVFTPLPGLQQIAVVSVFGILGAWLTVVLAFPYLFSKAPKRPANLTFYYLFRDAVDNLPRWVRFVGMITLFGVILLGLGCVKMDDRVELLRPSAPTLDWEEQVIRSFLPSISSSKFLYVEGKDDEIVLQRLESLQQSLDSLRRAGKIEGYTSVAQALPSDARRRENYQLLQAAWSDSTFALEDSFASLGFSASALRASQDTLAFLARTKRATSVEQELQNGVFRHYPHLWFSEPGYRGAVVLLEGDVPTALLQEIARKHTNVVALDRMDTLTTLLKEYRERATMVVLGAYLLIGIVLLRRYKLRKGFLVIVPPLLSAAFSLALVSLLGYPLHLFHLIGLLLILGMGVDYAIFYAEGVGHSDETMLGVALATISTVLAFGLLVFSATPALKAIGMIVIPGMCVSFMLARWAEKK